MGDRAHALTMAAAAPPPRFAHEKLDVYQAAVTFLALVHELIPRLPRGKSALADQIERAAMSILFNIAEGCGEFSPKEKVRFYRIALRSATECAAILDAGRSLGAISAVHQENGKALLDRIVAMLTALVHAHSNR